MEMEMINQATDELMKTIIAALNQYILRLAEQQILLAFNQAEKEVADLHQRTKEGIETARLNGKQIGQPKGAKLITKKSIAAKKEIAKYSKDFEGTLGDAECIRLVGVARGTYYKYKRELREECARESQD
jgi:DNA invertase Pin-like site-specific DNA recombinase